MYHRVLDFHQKWFQGFHQNFFPRIRWKISLLNYHWISPSNGSNIPSWISPKCVHELFPRNSVSRILIFSNSWKNAFAFDQELHQVNSPGYKVDPTMSSSNPFAYNTLFFRSNRFRNDLEIIPKNRTGICRKTWKTFFSKYFR